ncbi:glucosamine-6-phosphate deaminase [Peribacillus sp. SCS-155]|uniref:glucosamine-6-phosphate deaminase n=1 Tax=Peribacillus sedimenti TaxID=3115297 RepID=UPI003905E3E5
MNLLIADNYDEMSRMAAEILINEVKANPSIVLGLATGSTPVGMYKQLIQDHRSNGTDYSQVQTVNLDEYIGLEKTDPNSYFRFMQENLFKFINIAEEKRHIPNGTAVDPHAEAERYDHLVQQLGGIDLQVLGIGQNGHIGFNEPGTPFSIRTHIVNLADSTRRANARFFDKFEQVPEHAITMGIANILESRHILLLASGASKADSIKRLMEGDISEIFPASALKLHKNATIIADQQALQLTQIK